MVFRFLPFLYRSASMAKIQHNPDQMELFNPQKFTRYPMVLTRLSIDDLMAIVGDRISEVHDNIVALNEEELALNGQKRSA
jgi:hypothetical protein